MLKLPPDNDGLTLPTDQGTQAENRTVLVQPNQPVMIPHQPGENPWTYLVGYDFADDGEDDGDWRPGHA